MNIFLLRSAPAEAGDARRGRDALEVLRDELGVANGPLGRWCSPSGTLELIHSAPADTGVASYVHHDEQRMALFAGRPIRWRGDFEADGQGPLNAAQYLDPGGLEGLDGRYAAARYDDSTRVLEVRTDALGAYPVYTATLGGARWISNNPELLRRVAGATRSDPFVLASLIAGGWSLTGHPRWAAVRRMPRGVILRYREGVETGRTELPPTSDIADMIGSGFDPSSAARALVAGFRALADWPGRCNVVPVTAGRDSRVVLAAALRSEVEFEPVTYGRESDLEVQVARELCQAAGVPHRVIEHPGLVHAQAVISRLNLTSAGTASLEDSNPTLGPYDDGTAPLWHTGQGGEIGRCRYGRADDCNGPGRLDALANRLYTQNFTCFGEAPGDILSDEAKHGLVAYMAQWMRRQTDAGVPPADVPDAFYLLQRMSHWAAPRHAHSEYRRPPTAPLWSIRLLPDLLGAPAPDRERELFHSAVLRVLAPELLDVRFGKRWAALESPGQRRVRQVRSVAGHVRRRLPQSVGDAVARRLLGPPDKAVSHAALEDPHVFPRLLAEVKERVMSSPEHEVRAVLDRKRTEALLDSDPADFDKLRRFQVCRLATLYMADS